MILSVTKGAEKKQKKADAGDRLKYLVRKGSFPYEFGKSVSYYCLPNLVPKAFYKYIIGSNISEENYYLAKEIWVVFNMKCTQNYIETC